jgi:polyferredoxin
MPLSKWPKVPIVAFMLVVTATYLYLVFGSWYWTLPAVALAGVLLIFRKWEGAWLAALALLLVGLYFANRYGGWELFGMSAGYWYAVLYTLAIVTMGVRFIRLYAGKDRYMVIRTWFNMFAQLCIGFLAAYYLVPFEFGGGAPDAAGSGVFLMYVWPLEINAFLIHKFEGLHQVAKYWLAFNLIAALGVMPVLVYLYGKRPYCSWLCGCGCLAETFGDPFRRLTPRSRLSRILEPVIQLFVLAAVGITIWTLLTPDDQIQAMLAGPLAEYDLIVKFGFASLVGVGAYSLLGARIWCRYFCPWAGLFGLLAKYGRYSIKTRGELCIGCGMCNTYCEMGIDIRGFAMRGEPVKVTTCVGCGMCIQKCPRRVLSFSME